MATKQPDPATAAPDQLVGERAHVQYGTGTTFTGRILKVETTTRGQRILHINWQDSVVRSVDPTNDAVRVRLLDTDGGGGAV